MKNTVSSLGVAGHSVWGAQSLTADTNNTQAGYWGDPEIGGVTASPSLFSYFSTTPSRVTATAQGSAEHRCFADNIAQTLTCAGPNNHGQVPNAAVHATGGVGLTVAISSFNLDADPSSPKLAVGAAHTCAVTGSGQLFCWGDDTFGQLGIHDANFNVALPVAATMQSASSRWVGVAAGARHTCATVELVPMSYQVYCWGAGNFGQLGADTTGNEPNFQQLPKQLQ